MGLRDLSPPSAAAPAVPSCPRHRFFETARSHPFASGELARMDLYAFETLSHAVEAVWDEPADVPAEATAKRGLRLEDNPLQPSLTLADPAVLRLLGLPACRNPRVD